ncbi:hypothetical protein [Chitinophaga sp. sic0106]|uniref:hypothetical protein n=1 Tax=Chitinophaga sp. sic0106 TaxID=2854785 RepID=UPI001C47538C|nr:hypothetical protein [Chitinophaga sp. sic0106]MBV7532755.1 hypothetical protein [Chitinophaga sp. sic0106]
MYRMLLLCWLISLYEFSSAQSEHSFLHIDKKLCFPGDTIWYKGSITSDSMGVKESSTFYVELYDMDNQIMIRQQYPIIEGFSQGQMVMPAASGNYWLRAYTRNAKSEAIESITVRPDSLIDFTLLRSKVPNKPLAQTGAVTVSMLDDTCIINIDSGQLLNYSISVSKSESSAMLSFPVAQNFVTAYDTSLITIAANASLKNRPIVTVFEKDSILGQPQVLNTNESGKVVFSNLLFFDTAYIQYSEANKKVNNIILKSIPDTFPPFTPPALSRFIVDTFHHKDLAADEIRKILTLGKSKTLKTVIVKARWNDRHLALNKRYVMDQRFAAIEQFSFDLRDPINPGRIYYVLEYLRQQLPPGWYKNSINTPTGCSAPIEYYVDEKLVSEGIVRMMPLQDFAYAKVFKDLYPCVAVLIYTKKGEDMKYLPSFMHKLRIVGYNKALQWSTPDETTLHWNPYVTAHQYKFITPASPFTVNIIGMFADGTPLVYQESISK